MRRPRPPGPLTCGCDRPHYARGLCGRHYNRLYRPHHPKPPRVPRGCSEPGCAREHHARGLCQLHYQETRRELRAPPRARYWYNPLVPQIEELAQTMMQHQIARLLKISRNLVIGVVDRARKMGRLPDPKAKPYTPPREIFPPPGRCLWMDGDPRDPDSHFCGAPVFIFGEAWCAKHRMRVYVPRWRVVSNSNPEQIRALAVAEAAD